MTELCAPTLFPFRSYNLLLVDGKCNKINYVEGNVQQCVLYCSNRITDILFYKLRIMHLTASSNSCGTTVSARLRDVFRRSLLCTSERHVEIICIARVLIKGKREDWVFYDNREGCECWRK